MNECRAMPQDEAATLIGTLTDVVSEELGKSVTYSGKGSDGLYYFIIFPPIDDAFVFVSKSSCVPIN